MEAAGLGADPADWEQGLDSGAGRAKFRWPFLSSRP